jgi:hypothetical protein
MTYGETMKKYRTTGHAFPFQWEDIIPQDTNSDLPSFTIMTRSEFDDQVDKEGFDEDINWHDVVVDAPEITKALAIKAIAERLKVPIEQINIVEC